MVLSCLLRFGVDVDEYEGPEERASRAARPGDMKQKCNLSKFVSIVSNDCRLLVFMLASIVPKV